MQSNIGEVHNHPPPARKTRNESKGGRIFKHKKNNSILINSFKSIHFKSSAALQVIVGLKDAVL